MTMSKQHALEAARLMNLATSEVDTGSQDAKAEFSRGSWRVSRPSTSLLATDTRWRSANLAVLRLGKPTLCFACWERRLQMWRMHRPESERRAVREQCCGIIGCPGPLVSMDTQ